MSTNTTLAPSTSPIPKRDKSPAKYSDDPAIEKQIRELVRKRGIIKGRLTKFTTYVESYKRETLLTAQDRLDLKLRVQGVAELFKEFNEIQTGIENRVNDCDLEEHASYRDLFEEAYYKVVANAQLMFDSLPEVAVSSNSRTKLQSVKLPTISLPSFDGAYEHWLEFRDTFLSLVHNSKEISNIEKFHYLKSSLKGSAELVIESLEFSASNYFIAWDLLLNRYNNSRLLVHNHVRALFTLPTLPKESPNLIRNLIDTLLKNLRALKILGEPTDAWDTLIIFLVVSKLDKTTEREWEQYKGSLYTNTNSTLDSAPSLKVPDIISFLKSRADMLETLLVSHSKDSKQHNITHKTISHTSVSQCNVSHNKHKDSQLRQKKGCLLCNVYHPLYACQRFLDMNLDSRLKFVTDNKLCTNCLRVGHTLPNCRYGPCRKCDIKHNSLLHSDEITNQHISMHSSIINNELVGAVSHDVPPRAQAGTNSFPTNHDSITPTRPIKQLHSHSNNAHNDCASVLLSTAMVEVIDNRGIFHIARALLDNGSQRCFITKILCEKLNAPTLQTTHEIRGVGGSISQCTETCDIELKSRFNAYTASLRCFVLPQITSPLPAVCESRALFCLPDNIQLADPHFYDSKTIDLLIGADLFWDLLSNGKMRLPNGPFLQNTQLGWIISGPIEFKTRNDRRIQCNFTQSLDTQLRLFWELEELPRDTDTRTDEERACEEYFVRTTKRNEDGRFVVSLPLKQSAVTLGDTFHQAERRFLALEKRLQRSPSYKSLYAGFIREYLDLGHMSRVSTYETPHYFMPHHGVFREHSTTTKLRVVFDASAASSSGQSLNDLQMVGEPIQGDLFAILLRFRQHRYVACADIEKMYRQVLIDEQQRNLQLILWRDDSTEPISIFKLNTVTYGTASAPFLSVRCLKQLAVDCTNPRVKQIINEDFYVDDMITGHDSRDQLLQLCHETASTLRAGCFSLRKWIYNFSCDENSHTSLEVKPLSLGENAHSKTLGIGWFHSTDEFHFSTQFKIDNEPITKRKILSNVSQIFDPLGILSPTIMIAKVLLQQLWLLKIEWDDPVPDDVTRTWNRFIKSLSILSEIRVPRHVIGTYTSYIELHVFSDASQVAYGACIYVRTINKDSTIEVRLLCSKGKVAPLKPVSIPRLELCGAQLAARLYDKVRRSMRCLLNNVTFWVDSTIVLGWLKMRPNLLKTFVQNRIAEIHDLTKDIPWRHVSGKENPADLISRGLSLEDLHSSALWWNGPSVLHDPDFSSVKVPIDMLMDNLPETKPNVRAFVTATPSNKSWFPFGRFSQYGRMIRTVAYIKRFIYNLRNKTNRLIGIITVDEFKESEKVLIRSAQQESFSEEYLTLQDNRQLKSKHNLSKFNLFIDNDQIIRIGGRLNNSIVFSYEKKHPVLLSCKHIFSVLLFTHTHRQTLHTAPQALLFHLRESWWPLGGRSLARKVVHDCVTCKRVRGKTLSPLMGNLPKERITPTYPFIRSGVDYAGPVLVLNRKGRGAKTVKGYICIFVCFVTRAVHLELVSDLTADAYCLALKRFISRRGKPLELFSDNGRNFVGLMNDFSDFLSKCSPDILEFASTQQIKFRFIPPYSPHFGGLWEAGVKSCKYHLRRVVGNAHLTVEEFSTILAQVEAVLNSRPLTPLSSDSRDYLPLTPAHFLVGRTLTAPACEDLQLTPAHRLSRYQRLEQLRQHFWSRWATEYISELQTRAKWKENTAELKPNTLVLIKDSNLPPLKWQLGRIIRTIPGKDGIARVADIQTPAGITRRVYAKICPLVEPEDQEPMIGKKC